MNISSADLDLDGKIIIISGKSGQGKSAVIDALALCLSSKKRSALYSEYVKQGCTHSKVILDCIINNEPVNFNLQINLVRGTPFQMNLTYKGKVYKNTEATEILQSFDIEYYADIIFSMQSDDFKDITQLSPTQRANYLQRLLNFDFLEEKEALKKNIDDFTAKLLKISNDLSLFTQLKEKEELEKENLITIKTDITEIEKYKKNIEENQKLIAKAQEDQIKINELNKLFNENAEKLNNLFEEETELKSQFNTLHNHSIDIKKYEDEIENLEENRIVLRKELRKLDMDKNAEDTRITALNKQIKETNEERKKDSEISKKLIHIQTLYKDKKCPHCGQDTTTHALLELTSLLATTSYKSNSKVPSIEHAISYFEKKIIEYDADLFSFEHMKSTINEEIIKVISEISIKQSNLSTYEKTIASTQTKIDNSNYDPLELVRLQSELTKLAENRTNLILDQDQIKYDLSKFSVYNISDISDKIVKLTNIINEYEASIQKNNEIKERNKKREESIKNYQIKIDEQSKESGDITSQLNIHNEAYNILDKTLPNYMVINTCSKLQEEMNNFIQSIFPTYEVRLSNSKKGCEFFYTKDRTIIEQDKKKNNAWINSKMSSGFEKAALTLSFKVSLAQLYSLNIIIGDEIDQNADNESSEKLFENLITLPFDQLFLITHKNEIKEFINENLSDVKNYEVKAGVFESSNN
jgi:DNA repair exonuclease SbcCD ATPase subunit